ncbi:MAG: phosphatase PAP2 family protein [Verrucomicrobiota bacterium]
MRPALLTVIPFALLGLATWLFHVYPWDLEASGTYYDADLDSWYKKDHFPWKGLYDFGQHPALIVSFFGLVGFIASFFIDALKPYRRRSIYLLLVLLLGPGLLINGIFKEYWGRPRPRDTTPFDGKYAYEKVLTYDASSPGKSFPSGHASMGFYFMCFYFVFRKRSWRIASLFFGLAFGAVMGWARIVQGGHFASDVVFSAGMTFLSAVVLAYILKLNREIEATETAS